MAMWNICAVLAACLLLIINYQIVLSIDVPELKVSIIKAEGFCMYDDTINEWSGFIPELVRKLGGLKNFKPKFVQVADGRYGAFEEKSGTWSGMIGEVVNGTADFAAAPLTQTAQREKHIDFSHEILDVGLVAVTKMPTRIHPVTRSAAFFLGIFDAGVWICAIVVFVVTSLLIYLNDRYNPREQIFTGHSKGQETRDFGILGSAFYVISTGCFQGYRKCPASMAGRCLSVFWWVFASIFAATYVAGFLCGLVASRGSLNHNFATLDPRDRYAASKEFSHHVPVWLPGGSTDHLLKTSKDPVFRLFHKLNAQFREGDDKKQMEKLKTLKDLIELLETDEKFFGLMESDIAYWYVRQSNCKLVVASSLLNDRSYAFAFKEKSTWRDPINEALLELRESGFISATYRKFFGGPLTSCDTEKAPDELLALDVAGAELARMFRDSLPITLATFAGPLLLYGLGLLVVAAAAAADVFIYTRYERGRPTSQPFHNFEDQPDPTFGRLGFHNDREPVVAETY